MRGAGDDVEAVWADGERAERRALLEPAAPQRPGGRARAAGRDVRRGDLGGPRGVRRHARASASRTTDEPLLETALDDRRKPVRDAAVELLVRLPRSRFAARMAARTAPLLRVEDDALRRRRSRTTPDAAAARDGVPAGGRRSERLRWMLAATPLATWTGDAPSPPGGTRRRVPRRDALADAGDLARARPSRDDLADVVHSGWAAAAIAQRDAAWARALWEVRPEPELLLALPHDEAQRIAAAAPDPDVAARGAARGRGAASSRRR